MLKNQLLNKTKSNMEVKPNGTSCCVDGCYSRYSPNNNISFFSFPKPNKHVVKVVSHGVEMKMDRRQAWEFVTNRQNVSNSTRVCALHFKKDDYILSDYLNTTKRPSLKVTAVPSLLLFTHRSPFLAIKKINKKELTDDNKPKWTQRRKRPLTMDDFTLEDLECPQRAKIMYNTAKRIITRITNEVKYLKDTNKKLERRIALLERENQHKKIPENKNPVKRRKINSKNNTENLNEISEETDLLQRAKRKRNPKNINKKSKAVQIEDKPKKVNKSKRRKIQPEQLTLENMPEIEKVTIKTEVIEIEEHDILTPEVQIKEENDPEDFTNFEFMNITPDCETVL